ncbi:hypothetical protein DKX38_005444 [Salix brachista]|uniref:Uncharacterized protein n=1 Tax=Salix brachista TaxID=2182728 RepID=A0A5N5MZW0_9ROSI|nr:hypothetical protein DKX38_005444 [Salix brachista]
MGRNARPNGPHEERPDSLVEKSQPKVGNAGLGPAKRDKGKEGNAGLGPARRDKGKEKMEGYGLISENTNTTKYVTEDACDNMQHDHMESLSPRSQMANGEKPLFHQAVERNLGPEPPDEVIGMEEISGLHTKNGREGIKTQHPCSDEEPCSSSCSNEPSNPCSDEELNHKTIGTTHENQYRNKEEENSQSNKILDIPRIML